MKRRKRALGELLIERKPSWITFAILILVYVVFTIGITFVSKSTNVIIVNHRAVPVRSFVGALSGTANLCIILIVVLYKRPGFWVSLSLLVFQFPMIAVSLFVKHEYTSIAGFFANLLAIFAIYWLYINNRRVSRYQAEMKDQVTMDQLTKLPNHISCKAHMDDLVARDEKFAVAILDLNNFRSINNAMGRATGDAVIVEVANRFKKAMEKDEEAKLELLYHNSGDEFVLLVHDFKNSKEIEKVLSRYRSVLNDKVVINNCDYFISARVGYAIYPDDADNVEAVYAKALTATAAAKNSDNRDHICHFLPSMRSDDKDIEIERNIRQAIADDRVQFTLQPQYDMNHNIRGFETLAIIVDVNGERMSPVDFIPVAEKADIIDQIDNIVLSKASKFVAGLMKKTKKELILCSNISVKHLMKRDFIKELKETVKKSGASTSNIEIEITESIMVNSMGSATANINELKKLGFKIAIDDFGTGYSSLSYLNSFPADILKIDKSFIDNITTNKDYVEKIISIGHLMELEVVAEGVENEEQLNILKSINCNYVQGYYWGKPMLPEDIEKLF